MLVAGGNIPHFCCFKHGPRTRAAASSEIHLKKEAKYYRKRECIRLIERLHVALAGVAQWIEHWPVNQRVGSQSGHMPGLWARSPVGGTREATTH